MMHQLDFQREAWPSITSSGKDFMKELLVTHNERLTAANGLCTPLFAFVLIFDAHVGALCAEFLTGGVPSVILTVPETHFTY